jgi:ATP-dependent DNA ligase
VIPIEGSLSFDALQMRLHPAESRISKLARETPAVFVAFDCLLRKPGRPLLEVPFEKRRDELEAFLADEQEGLSLTPFTRDVRKARTWLRRRQLALDGVVAKRLDLSYQAGERAMLKVKCLRRVDCVVGGFRYATNGRLVGSLLLGLYDDAGLLHHVGFTSAIASKDKPDLTARLEKLVAPPGFTGDAPGGPSRWSTERSAQWQPLRPKLVVEVRYDHMSGGRFRHGTRLVRWRPDKSPKQCTFAQLPKARAALVSI